MYVQRCPVCGFEHRTNDLKEALLICPNGHEAIGGVAPKSPDELEHRTTVITFKNAAGERIEVSGFDSPDHSVIVGRGPDCACGDRLTADPAVSRTHLLLFLANGEIIATDLSTYGATKLNGHILTNSVALQVGDDMLLGDTPLKVDSIIIGSEDEAS